MIDFGFHLVKLGANVVSDFITLISKCHYDTKHTTRKFILQCFIWNYSNPKTYDCKICNKVFLNGGHLNRHNSSMHNLLKDA